MAKAKTRTQSVVDKARKTAQERAKIVQKTLDDAVSRTEKLRDQLEARAEDTADQTRRRAAKLALSVVDFQKTTFDNTFKVITQLQEQSEKIVTSMLNDADWMPKEGKAVVKEWTNLLKSARRDFEKTVDRSFDLISDLLERVGDAKPAKKKKAAAKKKTAAKKKPAAKKKAAAKKPAAKKKATAKKKPAAKKKTAAKKKSSAS
jgi:hypothetical protein